jgi:hypothetical protein
MKVKQRNRPVTEADERSIESALAMLNTARTLLRGADSHNAAAYVARAIKSTQGALTHARGMLDRQTRENVK